MKLRQNAITEYKMKKRKQNTISVRRRFYSLTEGSIISVCHRTLLPRTFSLSDRVSLADLIRRIAGP